MASFLEKILRTGDKRVLRQLEAYTKAVNSLEDSFASMTDEELRAETDKFRERVRTASPSIFCCRRPSRWFVKRPSVPWASVTTMCR